MDLLQHRFDVFSQNGEDGIIERIFESIGTRSRVCCEFGAWDGIHLSNCRNLVMHGWKAVMIEGDSKKHEELAENYKDNNLVICVNKYVDSESCTVGSILRGCNQQSLDFLSIDIDGLDYEILETLDVTPSLICIEVNAGHSPDAATVIARDTAKNNVGQSLKTMGAIASKKGYGLVCYNGNAFFVRNDLLINSSLQLLTEQEAYRNFLNHLDTKGKEWLYLVNKGLVEPYYRYSNRYLTRVKLGIDMSTAFRLLSKIYLSKFLSMAS
jgi:hypothetical protein